MLFALMSFVGEILSTYWNVSVHLKRSYIFIYSSNNRNSIPHHIIYTILKIPLYALVWKLSHDLEREIKFLKHFAVLVRLIGIWSRPKDEYVLPEYTSQKIGLDLKISSLITSFHQTQFIWKANYLAKLSSSRHLFEKLIFFFGKYNTNTSPYKSDK